MKLSHLLSLEVLNNFEFLRESVLESLASRIRVLRLCGCKPRGEVSVGQDAAKFTKRVKVERAYPFLTKLAILFIKGPSLLIHPSSKR